MARKKSSEAGATRTKSATKKGAVKKKKTSGSVATETAAKSGTPKVGRPKKSAATKAAGATKSAGAPKSVGRPKKAPAVKINDRQREFLERIKSAGEEGYHHAGPKIEMRTIEALRERKLVKRGAKNKEKDSHPWTLTKLGEKLLASNGEAAEQGS